MRCTGVTFLSKTTPINVLATLDTSFFLARLPYPPGLFWSAQDVFCCIASKGSKSCFYVRTRAGATQKDTPA